MATTTTNLGLTLPAVSDAADIGVLNTNFQKLDEKCNPALFAPSGYGLGGSGKLLTSADNLDNITANGWYWWYDSRPTGALYNYCYMRVDSGDKSSKDYVTQTIRRSGGGGTIERYNKSGEWVEEWVNPPMLLGVEYRTTERWNGKPVYTKAVNCGAMGKNTADDVFHDAANIEVVWVSGGYWDDGSTRYSMPYIGGTDDNQIFASAYGSAIHRVHKGSAYNILDMTVMIKYTKSTD